LKAQAALALKPTHAPVRAYYTALAQLANVGASHESAVREAWHRLVEHCAGPLKWTLVREYSVARKGTAAARGCGYSTHSEPTSGLPVIGRAET
jgi:hypothetical protein